MLKKNGQKISQAARILWFYHRLNKTFRKIAIEDLAILQTGDFIISDRSIPIFVACPFMGVFKKRR